MKAEGVLNREHVARINQLANSGANCGGTAAEYRRRYSLLRAALIVEVIRRIAAGEDPDRVLPPLSPEQQRSKELRRMVRRKLKEVKRMK